MFLSLDFLDSKLKDFLDFDGPLHSAEILAVNRHGDFLPHPDLFAGIPVLHSLLEPFPQLQIVVSSDWRLFVDDETLKQLLGPLARKHPANPS